MDSLRLQFLILLVHIFEEDREVVSMNHFLFGSNLGLRDQIDRGVDG